MSSKIIRRLEDNPHFYRAQTILFYCSQPHEVQTLELLKQLLQEGTKQILVPKVVQNELKLYVLSKWNQVQPGYQGILEPEGAQAFDGEHIDFMLIPGVAFDQQKQRLGYGKAFYDRLLKRYTGLKCGLAFEFQVLPEIPHEIHDVPMDLILTEQNIYS